MSSRKTLIFIAAIGVGVFAGIALLNYVRGIENDVYADAQPVEVLIATADIPEGTPVAEAINSIVIGEMAEHQRVIDASRATAGGSAFFVFGGRDRLHEMVRLPSPV